MNVTQQTHANTCMYGQLIYDKGAKDIQWREDSLFNTLWWENWVVMYKTMNWTTILYHVQKLTQNGLKS